MKITDILEAEELTRNTKSTALNRALKQAYAQYPTAKNDIEAFASWAMDRQNNANDLIDRQADLNRRQDAVIKSIDQDNTDQEQQIKKLDQENNELAAELDKVEKRIIKSKSAATPAKPQSGAIAKPPTKAVPPGAVAISSPFATTSDTASKSQEKPTGQALAVSNNTDSLPGTQAFSAMVPQLGSKQKELPLDMPAVSYQPTDNVLEPSQSRTQDPKYAAARQQATDVEPKYYADIARRYASDPEALKKAMAIPEGNKDDQKIGGRYDPDDFDAMVLRLKKLAGAGPRKTVWDPVSRVYKTVPVTAPSDKK